MTGNVYRVSAGSDAGPVGLTGRCSPLTIALRAPTSRQPGPTMEYRPLGGSWRRVLTERVGTDVYQSPLAGFGDYALVSTAGPPGAAASGGRGGPSLLLVFLVAFLATAAGAVVLVRVGDRRRRAASGTVPRG
ncbi:MAG: hypothetical protein M3Z02_06580 [Actinomycetota bacterium]|nr:hypothetical protein [Actinomycetota bacterium]